jgi:hypothetical protein
MPGHANDCKGNNFTEMCTESGDAGAFYTGRSWADRGNSILGDTFSRIKDTGAPIPLHAQNVHAIHFDGKYTSNQPLLVTNVTLFDERSF